MNELEARVALSLAQKFSPLALKNLFERFNGRALDALAAPGGELESVPRVSKAAVKELSEVVREGRHQAELELAQRHNVRLLQLGEAGYPRALASIPDPPPLLYVLGELREEDALALAIVGSRAASYYGARQASRFAQDFATRRVTVISGLARGVDTAAHKGALEGGGRTIAIIGSGLLDIYPPENVRLAREIAQHGALVSEFPLKTPAHARNFPRRNRLIAGLSLGVLVAECGLKSGSLITARLANELGREVFAIPGKVDTDDSRGCHKLIKEGAHLVEDPADVYAELEAFAGLPIEAKATGRPVLPPNLSPTEQALWPLLHPSDPRGIDELIEQAGLAPAQVTSGLMTLELKRLARSLPGRLYVRLD
jgi:DNA processing protein